MSESEVIFGPMLLGTFLNCILYGVTVVQSFLYFQTYKSRDRWWMRAFVIYLLVCETLHTAFAMGAIYEPLVIRYGTLRVFAVAPIMMSAIPSSTVMISSPVQLFIAWRVKHLSKSIFLPAVICFFSIASFVGGVTTTVLVIHIGLKYSRFPQNDGAVITWLLSSAAADVMITCALVHSLSRKRTGFVATDDIINKIIRMTVQTGLVTALAAILDIMLFLLFKGTNWNLISDFALSKLYSNSILSTLNARGGWKTSTSAMRDNVLFGNGTSAVESNAMQIEVTVTTNIQTQEDLGTIPMKALGLEAGYDPEDSASEIKAGDR